MQTNRKRQFTQAVRLLAPGNEFILKVARLVPEAELPPIASVAAFELTATLETLQRSWRFRQPLRPSCALQSSGQGSNRSYRRTSASTSRNLSRRSSERRRITHHAQPGGSLR